LGLGFDWAAIIGTIASKKQHAERSIMNKAPEIVSAENTSGGSTLTATSRPSLVSGAIDFARAARADVAADLTAEQRAAIRSIPPPRGGYQLRLCRTTNGRADSTLMRFAGFLPSHCALSEMRLHEN
jgi:hypothetical protein